jgi:hypothetical protein
MNDRFHLNLLSQASPFNRRVSAKEISQDVFNADCLSISILPIDLPDKSASYRKDLVLRWLKVLPQLHNLRSLSIRLKADQEFFEAVCQMRHLESLFITTSNVTKINSLSNLEKLTRLHLNSFTRLVDISPLEKLDKIKILSISNSFKVENYDVIGKIDNLIALGLHGDESSPKNLRLPSLKPYSNLRQLRHLDLRVTTIIDNSYEILLKLENLERFDTFAIISKDLREKIKDHPSLKAGFFIDWDWNKKRFYENKDW